MHGLPRGRGLLPWIGLGIAASWAAVMVSGLFVGDWENKWVSILNALVMGLYGWTMCIAGRTDRVMLGAVVFIAAGMTSWIWVPIGATVIDRLTVFQARPDVGDLVVQCVVFTLVMLSIFPTLRILGWNMLGLTLVVVLQRMLPQLTSVNPWYAVAAFMHAAPAGTLFFETRQHVGTQRSPGACICGYDLTGLDAAQCPECGRLRGADEPVA